MLEGALWNFTVGVWSDRRASRCALRRDTGAPREAIARVCGMASEVRVRPRTLPSVSYPRGSLGTMDIATHRLTRTGV